MGKSALNGRQFDELTGRVVVCPVAELAEAGEPTVCFRRETYVEGKKIEKGGALKG